MVKLKSVRPIEYELQHLLGEGTFSTVYKALRRDAEFGLQQTVALKILKSQIELEKWRDEFVSLESVRSPRCVRVMGWDYIDGQPALILDWIEGITLSDWIHLIQNRKRTAAQVIQFSELIDEISEQVFEGLNDIFKADLIHGDLSLQNIMLTPQGTVKLVDFGLSNTKELNFTAEFVAPEILMGGDPSQQTDYYSLGRIREYIERKLKLPISLTTRLLLEEPVKRQFSCTFQATTEERNRRQELLAEIVRKSLSESQTQEKLSPQTQMIPLTSESTDRRDSTSNWFKNAAYFSLVILALNAVNAAPDTRPAHLYIKTRQWVEIVLNDGAPVYAPFDAELIPGRRYTIQWRTQNAQGERSLTAEPGQNMVLSDQFFSSGETE